MLVLISDNGGNPFKNGGNNFPLRQGHFHCFYIQDNFFSAGQGRQKIKLGRGHQSPCLHLFAPAPRQRARTSKRMVSHCFGKLFVHESSSYSGQNWLSSMFHVTDWYPTLLTLAGADLEELRGRGVDGVNQWEAVGSRGRTCPSLCSQLYPEYGMHSRNV